MATPAVQIHDIDVATANKWLDRGEAVLVDVREPFEHAAEYIPDTTINPLSGFDPSRLPSEPGKRVVLYCNSGNRSRSAAKKWLAAGADEVFHLSGGIQAWKQADLAVIRARKAPIDLMRQVQITTGSLVVIGAVLSLLLSPWLIFLAAFVGAGLVFAGASGFCGMARILAAMPWNRRLARGRSPDELGTNAQAA
jgi:rhodanese-related sulfurtransferase